MSFTCTNLPPAALNARIEKNGIVADYYCQTGFAMTSGTPRATCVGTNTWDPTTPPTCTVIDNTSQNTLPLWVPILIAALLSVILITCLILVIYYCCCGPGRCCGGNNRTRPTGEDHFDDDYYDDRQRYVTKDYDGNGYYYDGYSHRRGFDGPYVVPVDYRQRPKIQNGEHFQYVMVEPQQQQKNKAKQPTQKGRTTTSDPEVVNLVKTTNGQFVPLEKYLQDHPEAKLATLGDKDVVYIQDQGQKPDPKAPPKQAWRANNKRTPPRPVVRSSDSTLFQPVIVTVMNDLNDQHPAAETDKTQSTKKKGVPQQQHPQQQPIKQSAVVGIVPHVGAAPKPGTKKDKDKVRKDTKSPDTKTDKNTLGQGQDDPDGSDNKKVKDTANEDKTDDTDRYNTSDSMEPTRAQYVRSGSDLDTSLDDSELFLSTPPHSTKASFKRQAFTVRDYNRFRPAKDFPAWRPHTKPVRENNTSTQ